MAEIFAKCFRKASEGHALYEKVSRKDMRPGTVGYFNRQHDWVAVAQTLDKDGLASHGMIPPKECIHVRELDICFTNMIILEVKAEQ